MTAINDLTWQQLDNATTQNLIITDPTHGLCIKIGSLLNTTPTSMTTTGVVETLFELRELAKKAQDTVNVGKQVGERLAAFPPSTSGQVVDGNVLQVGSIVAKIPLSTSGITGGTN